MEERNSFEEFSAEALCALGHLMGCKEVCKNQRAVMKINRFRAWLMDLQPCAEDAKAGRVETEEERALNDI